MLFKLSYCVVTQIHRFNQFNQFNRFNQFNQSTSGQYKFMD